MRPYAVSRETLTVQLDALVAAGYEAVTFDTLRADRRPRRPIVLTFDDGYRSFLEVAAPLLEERGMRAVLFVVAGSLGGVNDWDRGCADLELLDADGVREVADRGHEVGAHAWRHAPLTEVPIDQLAREVAAARVVLEHASGRLVRSFSYPHGVVDAEVIATVTQCGFDFGCLDWRRPEPGWPESLALTRVDVGPDTDAAELAHLAETNALVANPLAVSLAEPFESLVALTLAAGSGRPPAEGWAAVHAASGPLTQVLRARDGDDRPRSLTSLVRATQLGELASPPAAVVTALDAVASDLDALVRRQAEVPVWGVATPDEATDVDLDWIRLGAQWSDVARLLWQIEPTSHGDVIAAYLRRSGRSHGRAATGEAMDELAAAEVAMLADEAVEPDGASDVPAVERSLTKVRCGAIQPAVRDGARRSSWSHLRMATGALVRQELREHYAGSLLGIGWAVARPLLYFTVLVLLFGQVVRVSEPRYPEFLLAGLVPWLFFQTAVGEATGSIRGRGDLLRLAAFPRVALPLATVASAVVDLAAQLLVVAPVLVVADGTVGPRLLALAPVLAALLGLVTMTSLLISGLCVRFRDVSHLVPLALFLGFYATPVFYSSAQVHMPWRVVYLLNPVAVIVETFRSVLYGGSWPPGWALAWTAVFVAVGGTAAWRWFSSAADRFVAEA
ncbi:MAG TPA: polysaccharide deacetylase family protein [Acidimicrobiales bacterium]|jgi:ABC-type polysaccharide/polyol phosphate export permease/peptidoglycan/xylan/chitin deacetylase (PgdA/CDA1 family)